jgi:predicted transcriptional regulator
MMVSEIKEKIAEKLKSTNDEVILEEVYRLLQEENSIIKLSDDLKTAINEGWDDVKRGNVVSHEDLKNEIKKWLKE